LTDPDFQVERIESVDYFSFVMGYATNYLGFEFFEQFAVGTGDAPGKFQNISALL
jgi:hypothetical protein